MLRAAAKQAKALELRKAGKSFDEIAKACGYRDKGGAHKAVMAALRTTVREPAEELRQLEIERLDAMHSALWRAVRKGQVGAIDRALKIIERRAALLGLNAPTRIESKIDVTKLSDAELDELVGPESGR